METKSALAWAIVFDLMLGSILTALVLVVATLCGILLNPLFTFVACCLTIYLLAMWA